MAETGFVRPALSELLERTRADMLARMAQDDVLRRADAEVYARVAAYAVHSLYAFVGAVATLILPDTAEDAALDRHGAWWDVNRKPATKATGQVTFTCSVGASVPLGAVLQREGVGDYVTTSSAIAVGTTVTVNVQAVEGGAAFNAAPGAVLTLVSPLARVQPKATAGELSGGADEEDDEALRARIRARYQEPPHGGNPADYVAWALEVPNVTRAWCYPGMDGLGTVRVTFVCDGRADIIPTVGDVAAAQAHIDEVRPATADVTVFAPTPVPIDPSIRLDPDTPEVRAAVLAELNDFIRREAIPAGTIRVSRLREAISSAAGEVWHDLTVPAADIDLPAGQISTLGAITWLP